MKKNFLLILFFFSISDLVHGRTLQQKPFSIKGSINIDSASVKLLIDADSALYPKDVRNLTTTVKNGEFTFEGVIPNPLGYRLLIDKKYRSDLIVVDTGPQTMKCRLDSSGLGLSIDNMSMTYNQGYEEMFEEINKKRSLQKIKEKRLYAQYNKVIPDSVKATLDKEWQLLYDEGDRTLVRFIQTNTDSYLGFWKLARLLAWGYEPVLNDAPDYLSGSIKRSFSGEAFTKLFSRSKALSNGEQFPLMALLDINGAKVTSKEVARNKYTLIDFWYSSCTPCIAQFPDLRDLFLKNRERGFNIVGISTDGLKYKNKWLSAIKKYKLGWTHYWDVNGKGATDLSIKAFPTNFLIDENGRIVGKNISLPELAIFLKKNL